MNVLWTIYDSTLRRSEDRVVEAFRSECGIWNHPACSSTIILYCVRDHIHTLYNAWTEQPVDRLFAHSPPSRTP